MRQYEIEVKVSFDAAHYLHGVVGPERALHGHRFDVNVVIASEALNAVGLVVHNRDITKTIMKVIMELDHTNLNDLPQFENISPTPEVIANVVFLSIEDVLPDNLRLVSVEVRTDDGYSVKYVDKFNQPT